MHSYEDRKAALVDVLKRIYGDTPFELCNRSPDALVQVIVNPYVENQKPTDFDLYCLSALLKQYGMIILLDDQNDIWLGDKDDILADYYFTAVELRGEVVKIY